MKYSATWFVNGHRISLLPGFLLPSVLLCLGCGGPAPLTVDMPLHLEDHLDAATIVGSEVPEDVPTAVEWRFDEPQPDWKPAPLRNRSAQRVKVSRTDDALRMMLRERSRGIIRHAQDGIYVDLPDWNREDWAYVDVRARASGGVAQLGIGFNRPEGRLKAILDRWGSPWPDLFFFPGDVVDVINDGSVQTYRMRADWSWRSQFWEGPWKQLGFLAQARRDTGSEPVFIDILSVSVIPKAVIYVAEPVGVRTEVRNQAHRRTLYTHAPGRIAYRVRIPQRGRRACWR